MEAPITGNGEEPGQKNGRTGGAKSVKDIDGGLCFTHVVDHHVVEAINGQLDQKYLIHSVLYGFDAPGRDEDGKQNKGRPCPKYLAAADS